MDYNKACELTKKYMKLCIGVMGNIMFVSLFDPSISDAKEALDDERFIDAIHILEDELKKAGINNIIKRYMSEQLSEESLNNFKTDIGTFISDYEAELGCQLDDYFIKNILSKQYALNNDDKINEYSNVINLAEYKRKHRGLL